jgi:hypothetical protein
MESDAQIIQPLALSNVDRELIDMQIATAKRYPRTVEQSMNRAVDAILSDNELAVDAFYEIPVAGQLICGPSVRSAEIIGQHWGNMRWEDRPVNVPQDANYVEGEAFAWDVENNVASRKIKRLSVVDSYGKRYSQYRVDNAQLKAQSVAKRDAIAEVVGKAYMKKMHRKAEEFLDKDFPNFEARKDALAAAFKKLGVTPDNICKYLTPPGSRTPKTWNLITHKEVFRLGNIYTGIKEGSTSVKDVFGVEGKAEDKKTAPDIKKPTDEAAEEAKADDKQSTMLTQVEELIAAIGDMDVASKVVAEVAKKHKLDADNMPSWSEAQILAAIIELKKAAPKAG